MYPVETCREWNAWGGCVSMSEGDEYIFVYYFCIIWFYPDIKQFLLHPVLCDEFCVQSIARISSTLLKM